jgi:lipocalin
VKLDFENYRGNELEVGNYGPKFEAEKDEILSHYLRKHD